MAIGPKLAAEQARSDASETAMGRGRERVWPATLISAIALAFSGYTFWESVLRPAELAVFVPPRMEYTDPDRPDSPFEVFIVPVTMSNEGAQTGTVLSLDLEVKNPRTGEVKRFYAAQLGTWGREPRQPFAPVALAGRQAFSEALQFHPRVDETVARIVDLEGGPYTFTLTLQLATGATLEPRARPLTFTRQLGRLDYRFFSGRGTMEMWSADYRSSATGTTGSGTGSAN